ncbi:alpha/beta hydrolase [Acidovorax sp. SUPP3334]|uniref:alpha/beta hydrolase n=1 Tax=Acidovorax sp. SUPP3334 TaxID=2920881 RepID=UPI0023DE2E4C|nr:alpha/beta hydrolase [Acidovorax sp. SUPP3334]GKT23051.1 alpha/beta hydrolase [Acidovorax sp. SUPP3334]
MQPIRFFIPSRTAAIGAVSALLLSACGGGGGGGGLVPEETRVQDTRTSFAVATASLPFAAMDGTTVQTDRWSGTNAGAGYRVEVPKNWNGILVMYAHGYAGEGNALTVSNPAFRRYLIENGYAWAASSYTKNFYDVRVGVEDTNALANAFVAIAAANGRVLSEPARTYVTGISMGGHIAAAAIEDEAQQTAVHQRRYQGALPMCAVLGDLSLYNYFGAYQLAAQKLAGVPATAAPTTDWAALAPRVRDAMFGSQTSFAPVTPQGQKLKDIVMNLTGGPRPIFDQGFANAPLQNTVWGTFGRDGTLNGILNKQGIDTTGTVYRFDASAAEVADFNATIAKWVPAPDANRLRTDGLRWVPQVNGQFRIPVVTLHTLGDMYVPFHMEQVYRDRVEANGNGQWLVQRAVRAPSHCDFTVAEQSEAFKAMADWVEKGTKPAGDDVKTPATVADARYGCTYTRNAGGRDDSAATVATRATLPGCSGS